MILADIRVVGVKRKKFAKFYDGHCPRIGESLRFGTSLYRILDVTHQFHYQDIHGAFHNEKYFADVPPLEITVKKV